MSDTTVNKEHWMYRLACHSCDEIKNNSVQAASSGHPIIFGVMIVIAGIILLAKSDLKNEKNKA